MLKKILKWIFKILISLLLLLALLFGGFHLWEYASGGKFVKYLSENSETIPLKDSFSYEIMEHDIEQSQLILVGEIHGFDEPAKFDVDFFKYLHKNHQVNYYLAELDFVQATLLNGFLKTGDQETLSRILKNWFVLQGRNNKDYFNKYLELQKYYTQLPDDNKFEFIGIDKIQDHAILTNFILELFPNKELVSNDSNKMEINLELIEQLNQIYSHSSDTLFILSHLKSNIVSSQTKQNREEVMFQNFSAVYKEYQLKKQRLYGFFGVAHVFQYRINGKHPLASLIRESDLGLENKILSINFMMNDSYMVMPSHNLPEFMRSEGPYSKMPISADNMLIIYIVGIKDFKRMTPEHHKSLIKLNDKFSPYANSIRLNKTIQILPLASKMEMTDKGKPYAQFTVFVRNSDWAEPME
ncbi:MAG: hypothetical protein DWP98_03605 [Bacteroidetes bacterium]|nr:MAG: hypothetical protein DWP98_03605 [Bacteroidota bacterium]NOG57014.1 hypothetical protein [Bacteroidota bacterium]